MSYLWPFATLIAATPSIATHGPGQFHSYSVGRHSAFGPVYSGLQAFRQDIPLSTAYPCIYQTQWVMDSSGYRWVELGSAWGSGCNTGSGIIPNASWFWGFAWAGVWYLQGTRPLNPSQSHWFKIYRFGNYYYYYVDDVLMNSLYWDTFFDGVGAGLESYMDQAVVTPHDYGGLHYTTSGGPWTPWDSQGWPRVDSQMCGYFPASTVWRASQNTAC